MKKTLLVMAAGIGTRYGGLKQIDVVGSSGEYLIDYAIYDALQAGFDKVVFVIKREFAREFKQHFSVSKFRDKIRIEYAYQELNDLPHPFRLPAGREKPWGTGQAVLAARNFIKEPFAVITSDDFYGRDAYKQIANFLNGLPKGSHDQYGMVGYRLGNTLSKNGWVARGLCKVNRKNYLTSIHEHTKIGWVGKKIISRDKKGVDHPLSPNRLVSMVMFGFTPDFFGHLQKGFRQFLQLNNQSLDLEFFTPNVVNDLIQTKQATMQVLPTSSHWFGMTYKQDKIDAVSKLKELIASGVYPPKLWEN